MTQLIPTWYTPDQVLPILMGPALEETWRFQQLDETGRAIQDVTQYVETATVQHKSSQDVKRTITMTAKAGIPVEFADDFIKVYHRIKMPAGDWLDFALGVFTFSIPKSTVQPARTTFNLAGQEPLFLLVEDSFTDVYSLPAGTAVIPAIENLCAQLPFGVNITDLGQLLATTLTWAIGDTKLKAINDLLAAIAYETAWCDHDGVVRARSLPDFTFQAPIATFDTRNPMMNNVISDITVEPDRSSAYNIVIVEVAPAGGASFSVVYTNNSPSSPVSVQNWHARPAPVVQNSTLVDQNSALAYAKSLAQQYARVFINVTFDTFPWAVSENMDVYQLIWDTPDEGLVAYNYVETDWQHVCGTGGATSHTFQRVVAS